MQSPSKLNRRRYRAPEYASGGKLVERPNSITSDACMGTRALEMGDFDSLTIARLEKNYNEREMFQMIETIAECIRHSAPMKLQMGLVSGFGLAKLAMDAVTHVTTRVMGTFGYMAPEYASSVKLTERSDVYSSNVVLLELITGRKPFGTSQPLGDESLVERVGATLVLPLLKFFFVCTLPQKPMSPPMELVMRALDGLACFNR